MVFLRRMVTLILCLYLSIYNGQLALFESSAQSPVQILPYQVSNYPKIDQQALKKGITVESATHLKQLLEDFLA